MAESRKKFADATDENCIAKSDLLGGVLETSTASLLQAIH